MKAAAFFDIDYTITKVNSGRRIIDYLNKRGLINKQFFWEIIFAFMLHKLNMMSDSRIVRFGAKFFKGKSKSEIERLAKEAFDSVVKQDIYQEMANIIKEHKKKKCKIIIVTNEFDIIAEQFKEYLKIDHILTSELEVNNGIYTGNIKGEPCSGNKKGRKAKEIAEKLKIDLSKSYAYTDSISDLSLLKSVGNPVAVNPDKKLLRIAKKNSWKIFNPRN